jgi:hypothetical protein
MKPNLDEIAPAARPWQKSSIAVMPPPTPFKLSVDLGAFQLQDPTPFLKNSNLFSDTSKNDR